MQVIRATLTPRPQILATGLGLITESFPRGQTTSSIYSLPSGWGFGAAVALRAGDIITNIHVAVATAAVAVTACKVALYSASGTAATRVAISADLGTSWESTGTKTHALTSAYSVPADGVYFAAAWHTRTTTSAALARCLAAVSLSDSIGSFPPPFSQADWGAGGPPTSFTLDGADNGSLWVGLS